MLPSLADGDRLLVRWGARCRPGDIAVLRLPPHTDGTARPISLKRLVRAEAGGWWVERDNPNEGVDSWQVGPVADNAILARVVCRVWPRPGYAPKAPRG